MKAPFTLAEGLLVQVNHFGRWSEVFNERATKALLAEVLRQNEKLIGEVDGYDVWRGQDMTNYVINNTIREAMSRSVTEQVRR